MRVRSRGRPGDLIQKRKRRLRDRFDSSRQGAELFKGSSALPVISLVLREAALDDCVRDRPVDGHFARPRCCQRHVTTAKSQATNLIVYVQRIPQREPAGARIGVQLLTRSTSRRGRQVNRKVGNDSWVRAASVRDLHCAMAGKLTTIFGEPA
jgi:hypothetical protein